LARVQQGSSAQIARVEQSREDLAKEWLMGMIDRTPLAEVESLPIGVIAEQGPPLITEILRGLADPFSSPDLGSVADARRRAGQLGQLRRSDDSSALPRDLAALQSLLIAALRREVPERESGAFADAVQRLAEIFGTMQAEVTAGLVEERSGGAARDELTGLPGAPHLHEWLRALLAGHDRYGQPVALLGVDIDGLKRINEAYGREVGDRMLTAVGEIVHQQIRAADQAFRLTDDEFCVLAPSQEAEQLRPLAHRLREAIEGSQAPQGPRVEIAVGIASCPQHGKTPERLLKAVEEATYRAKASGEGVAVGWGTSPPSVQLS
jgi:diguanylate cyclase (GGDEF)-like protein